MRIKCTGQFDFRKLILILKGLEGSSIYDAIVWNEIGNFILFRHCLNRSNSRKKKSVFFTCVQYADTAHDTKDNTVYCIIFA